MRLPGAWAFGTDCDIVPAPVWRRRPSPPSRRPMRPGLGRDHRGGAASRPHARVADPSRVDRTRPGTGPRIAPMRAGRSEEHTSELQSLMRISYAVFCLKKKKKNNMNNYQTNSKNQNTNRSNLPA